jgi:hypothetical protein
MIESILENSRFLVIETENQVKLTYGLLNDFNEKLLEKIASKDDYIDNLKISAFQESIMPVRMKKRSTISGPFILSA